MQIPGPISAHSAREDDRFEDLRRRVALLETESKTRQAPDADQLGVEMADETRAARQTQDDALKDRLDMAETMFRSVMDVDTHLDNKAQRTLGAIAFLTAATAAIFTTAYKPVVVRTSLGNVPVAMASAAASPQASAATGVAPVVAAEVQQIAEPMPIGSRGAARDVRARLDSALVSAPTQYARGRFRQFWGFATPLICFFGFVVSVLVSVALYLAALGPTFHLRLRKTKAASAVGSGLPTLRSGGEQTAEPPPDDLHRVALDPERPGAHEDSTHAESLLFFRSIAAMPMDVLLRAWNVADPTEPVADLRRRLLESYVYEAQVVSQKAVAKFRWLSAGSILLRVALIFLGLLVASLVADVDRQFVVLASLALCGLFGAFAFEMGHRPSEHGRDASVSLTAMWATASACAFVVFLLAAIWNVIPF